MLKSMLKLLPYFYCRFKQTMYHLVHADVSMEHVWWRTIGTLILTPTRYNDKFTLAQQ